MRNRLSTSYGAPKNLKTNRNSISIHKCMYGTINIWYNVWYNWKNFKFEIKNLNNNNQVKLRFISLFRRQSKTKNENKRICKNIKPELNNIQVVLAKVLVVAERQPQPEYPRECRTFYSLIFIHSFFGVII